MSAMTIILAGCGADPAVTAATEQIASLGDITLNSEDVISAALDSYNALSDEQKALVENADILTEAQKTFDQLVAEEEKRISEEQIEAVKNLINAIGDVTLNSESAIAEAEKAYNALTSDQKSLLPNADTLTEARQALEDLIEVEELKQHIKVTKHDLAFAGSLINTQNSNDYVISINAREDNTLYMDKIKDNDDGSTSYSVTSYVYSSYDLYDLDGNKLKSSDLGKVVNDNCALNYSTIENMNLFWVIMYSGSDAYMYMIDPEGEDASCKVARKSSYDNLTYQISDDRKYVEFWYYNNSGDDKEFAGAYSVDDNAFVDNGNYSPTCDPTERKYTLPDSFDATKWATCAYDPALNGYLVETADGSQWGYLDSEGNELGLYVDATNFTEEGFALTTQDGVNYDLIDAKMRIIIEKAVTPDGGAGMGRLKSTCNFVEVHTSNVWTVDIDN